MAPYDQDRNRCWCAVIPLLTKGMRCRGYMRHAPVYHTNNQIVGSGDHNAYGREQYVTACTREIPGLNPTMAPLGAVAPLHPHGNTRVFEYLLPIRTLWRSSWAHTTMPMALS